MSAIWPPFPIECDGHDGQGCPDNQRFVHDAGCSPSNARALAAQKGWRASEATADYDYCPDCWTRAKATAEAAP